MTGVIPLAAHLHLDNTVAELGADLVVVMLLGLNITLGVRHGALRRMVTVIGIVGGVSAATRLGNPLGGAIMPDNRLYGNALGFLLIFIGFVLAFELLGALYDRKLRQLVVIAFDGVVGGGTGLLAGFLEAGILFLISFAVAQVPTTTENRVPSGHATMANEIRASTLGSMVSDLEDGVTRLFGPLLPSDLPSHLADGTPAF